MDKKLRFDFATTQKVINKIGCLALKLDFVN